jgi:hypothetical protein
MFFRQKRSGDHVYLQIVENRWEKGGSKQRVIATVGRLDHLRETGQLDGLLQSGAKFAESVMVLAAHRQGKTPAIRTRRIGPAMVFGKQMVVGAILDGEGRPLCCELWPGNVTDVKTLIPVVDRLQQRFRIRSICIVADRGMISQDTIAELQAEKRQVHFIKYLHAAGPKFTIDEAKVKWEERFDGKWVLQTDLDKLTAEETALQYKQLWMVEEMFRTVKTLLETRPIFHKCDETIRGHVFCSFLALLLRKELQDRLEAQGDTLEWAELLRDLESLQSTEVENQGKRFLLRSDLAPTTAVVFRAAGVAIPPSVQKTEV